MKALANYNQKIKKIGQQPRRRIFIFSFVLIIFVVFVANVAIIINSKVARAEDLVIANGENISYNSDTSYEGNVTVEEGGMVTLAGGITWTINGDLSVDGTIIFESNGDYVNYPTLSVNGDVVISNSGLINSNGYGYPGGGYNNSGQGPGFGSSGGGGGSHGGSGGGKTSLTYGDQINPITAGSGGGGRSTNGGSGGGAVRFEISGSFTNEGTITAEGADSEDSATVGCGGGGGGAGGSILLDIGTKISGTGNISAQGGDGGTCDYYGGSAGGGGRISIKYNNFDFPGSINANGGSAGTGSKSNGYNGYVGTIYKYALNSPIEATEGCTLSCTSETTITETTQNDFNQGTSDNINILPDQIQLPEANETSHIAASLGGENERDFIITAQDKIFIGKVSNVMGEYVEAQAEVTLNGVEVSSNVQMNQMSNFVLAGEGKIWAGHINGADIVYWEKSLSGVHPFSSLGISDGSGYDDNYFAVAADGQVYGGKINYDESSNTVSVDIYNSVGGNHSEFTIYANASLAMSKNYNTFLITAEDYVYGADILNLEFGYLNEAKINLVGVRADSQLDYKEDYFVVSGEDKIYAGRTSGSTMIIGNLIAILDSDVTATSSVRMAKNGDFAALALNKIITGKISIPAYNILQGISEVNGIENDSSLAVKYRSSSEGTYILATKNGAAFFGNMKDGQVRAQMEISSLGGVTRYSPVLLDDYGTGMYIAGTDILHYLKSNTYQNLQITNSYAIATPNVLPYSQIARSQLIVVTANDGYYVWQNDSDATQFISGNGITVAEEVPNIGIYQSRDYIFAPNTILNSVGWTANVPSGTYLDISISTDHGNSWQAVTNGQTFSTASARVEITSLMYRATFGRTAPGVTPALKDITFSLQEGCAEQCDEPEVVVDCAITDFSVSPGKMYREAELIWTEPAISLDTNILGYELRTASSEIMDDTGGDCATTGSQICFSEADIYHTQNWQTSPGQKNSQTITLEGTDPAGYANTNGAAPTYYFALRPYWLNPSTSQIEYCPVAKASSASNATLSEETLQWVEITFQEGDTKGEITATNDAMIYEGEKDTNYSTSTVLYYYYNTTPNPDVAYHSLISFPNIFGSNDPLDINQRGREQIPVLSGVGSGYFTFKKTDIFLRGRSSGAKAYQITASEKDKFWDENSIIWNSLNNDYSTKDEITVNSAGSENWYSFNAYTAFTNWLNGEDNYGMLLKTSQSGSSSGWFYSGEEATQQNRPTVVVEYEYALAPKVKFDIDPYGEDISTAECDYDYDASADGNPHNLKECDGMGHESTTFSFTYSITDQNGWVDSCIFDFGDGDTMSIAKDTCLTSSPQTITHQYNLNDVQEKTYLVSLSVSDGFNNIVVDHQVYVFDITPIARLNVEPFNESDEDLCDTDFACNGGGNVGTTIVLKDLSVDSDAQTLETIVAADESYCSMFRCNPQITGISKFAGPGSAEQPELLWQYGDPDLIGERVINLQPTIDSQGNIYFGTWGNATIDDIYEDNCEVDPHDRAHGKFFALNPDGTLKWKSDPGGLICHYLGTVETSPIINETQSEVIFGRGDGILYGLNMEDGNINWTMNTPEENEGLVRGRAQIIASPIEDQNGIIYFGTQRYEALTEKSGENRFYAVGRDINDRGEISWQYPPATEDEFNEWIWSIASLSIDQQVIFFSSENTNYAKWLYGAYGLFALDTAGNLQWQIPAKLIPGNVVEDINGILYVSTYNPSANDPNDIKSAVYALDPTKYNKKRPADMVKWKTVLPYRITFTPLVTGNGIIYISAGTQRAMQNDNVTLDEARTPGKLYALDADTGEILWEFELAGSAGARPPIMDANDVIYIASHGSDEIDATHQNKIPAKIWALDSSLHELWSYTLDVDAGEIWGGNLVVGPNNSLVFATAVCTDTELTDDDSCDVESQFPAVYMLGYNDASVNPPVTNSQDYIKEWFWEFDIDPNAGSEDFSPDLTCEYDEEDSLVYCGEKTFSSPISAISQVDSSSSLQITFDTAGTYNVRLTVTDKFGAEDKVEQQIIVEETVPETTWDPYLQTQQGDVYSEQGFEGNVDLSGFDPAEYNATYYIYTLFEEGQDKVNLFTSSTAEAEIGLEQSLCMPSVGESNCTSIGEFDFEKLTTKVENNNNEYGDEVVTLNDFSNLNNVVLGNKVYVIDNSPTISSSLVFNNGDDTTPNGSGLIIVIGDLIVNADVVYDAAPPTQLQNLSSAAWIIRGNLTISSGVNNLAGAFFVVGDGTEESGKLTTETSGNDEAKLVVSGLMMAKSFNFQRTFTGTTDDPQPAELIFYDGRVIANTPPGLRDMKSTLPVITYD